MKRLSSNMTLVLKIFIPLVYIVFFGSFLLGSLLVSINDAPFVGSRIFQLSFAGIFFLFVVLFYFTIWKLKRVDADDTSVYISNYVKTYRYTWDSIKEVTVQHYGLFRTMKIYFQQKGSYGKKITFLASNALVQEYLKAHPEHLYIFRDDL